MKRIVSITCFLLLVTLLHAEDWTMADGKTTYKDVKVISHDAAFVTIMYVDGGARVPLKSLNADLQKRLNYDAVKAVQQVAADQAQDARDKVALARERALADPAPAPAAAVSAKTNHVTQMADVPTALAQVDVGALQDQLAADWEQYKEANSDRNRLARNSGIDRGSSSKDQMEALQKTMNNLNADMEQIRRRLKQADAQAR